MSKEDGNNFGPLPGLDWTKEEGVEKFGQEYMRSLIKSQRNVITHMVREIESMKEENRQLRITLGMLDAVSIKAEEVRLEREIGAKRSF